MRQQHSLRNRKSLKAATTTILGQLYRRLRQIKAQDAENDDIVQSHSKASPAAPARPQRDEWMMLPPKQDDLAARMDPSKQRARAFNTGKGAKAPNNKEEDNSAWYETPEQKQRRLQEEMMGTAKPASMAVPEAAKPKKSAKEEAEDQKRRQQIEKSRGPSLVEQHKKSKGASAEEDDPSKRAFDREKDMASGGGISGAQKAEMLKKAAALAHEVICDFLARVRTRTRTRASPVSSQRLAATQA